MIARPPLRFAVGDEVVWTSVNHKGEKRHTVEKVGRTLVRISHDPKPYRIKDGARHDGYGHSSIRSLPVYEWDKRTLAAYQYFRDHGLQRDFQHGDAEEWIVAAAKILQAEEV